MPSAQENTRFVFLVILILWLNAGTDPAPAILGDPHIASRLARQRAALGVLNQTKWGDFEPASDGGVGQPTSRWLNLTGFRQSDGFAWEDFERFRDKCREWTENARPTYANEGDHSWEEGMRQPTWMNATGAVHGTWIRRPASVKKEAARYNLTDLTPAVTWLGAHAEWGRNVTGSEGRILIRLNDKQTSVKYEEQPSEGQLRSGGIIRSISASVTLEDNLGTGSTYDMRVHGVHWQRQGMMLLTTTSEKFAGIFGLPHLSPNALFFQSSQRLLNQTIEEALERKERSRFTDPTNPWSATPDAPQDSWNPAPQCEYILYAQVHPLNVQQLRILHNGYKANERLAGTVYSIEEELRNPTGKRLPGVPELQISALLFSPDCGYFLESIGPPGFTQQEGRHLLGQKEEVFLHDVRLWLLAWAAVIFGQVYLLKGQMKESYTPSTLGRVSFWTGSIMLMADGLIFATSSAWSLSATTTFLPSMMVTFAGFLAMTIGGFFLAEVYRVQEPERRNRVREQPAATTTPRPLATPTPGSLPRPVTAGPGRGASPPIIIPSDQDIDAEIAENAAAGSSTTAAANTPTTFSTIAGRFIMAGSFLLFLSLAATSWWAHLRAAYVNTLAFLYLSLWTPQIWRNIQRNSRRAFSWRFMIGQSVLRLAPFAYFYLREDNVLFADPDWTAFSALAAWLWLQLWVLAFQDVLGPRFGVPKGWTPEAWDYHPILREDAVETGGLPIGLVPTTDPASPDRSRAGSGGEEKKVGGAAAARGDRKRAHTRSIDCAICRETLEVPVVRAGAEEASDGALSVAGVLARRAYMVTPCRHIFHSECLEGWLRFRLQCPICREDLPPL
jgi:transmembrane E3 ubiquitin-protein ligase